jgi:hypothetical protein
MSFSIRGDFHDEIATFRLLAGQRPSQYIHHSGICAVDVMQLLVGWDADAATRKSDDNVVDFASNTADRKDKARAQDFDAILFSITFPDADQAFDLFETCETATSPRRSPIALNLQNSGWMA